MKKIFLVVVSLSLCFTLPSCNRKKLTEVVEVPLPSAEEKITIGQPDDVNAEDGPFDLIKLPYKYNELAPSISILAMEMHYSKHYLTYTNNLNKLVTADATLTDLAIEDILKKLDLNNADLRNNAGGFYNHGLFFESMAPKAGGQPKDTLAAAITKDFGDFENFKTLFSDAAEKQFGSGWAWLVVDKTGKLQVTSTPNQDNPLMPKQTVPGTPILCLDVWEHAYYLDYQYKRKRYIEAFFKVINWKKVGERYEEAIAKKS
ncbi:superoxide dismutase [Flavobacterium dankookense]|uniref:Superoxide dismutase n=1 Tax=Flavobacterium dankookense TaxID=706186 RepID=A0A4R6QC97_9FLAO|nr:superoxide dismutase [Flavobacterium dankookense]TDP59483.1 Fe-Mn family superoxide dismutase [Flavobacterium dankookense]